MKYWRISDSETTNTYLILTEKSFWITEQDKNLNIEKLIADKDLGIVKTLIFEELKEIIFIDSDFSIEFNFKDDNTEDVKIKVTSQIHIEIKKYLKSKMTGVEIKNYSILKQLYPLLIITLITTIFSFSTYFTAVAIENGENIRISGGKAWLKQIIVSIAELLGVTGTFIVGGLILLGCVYTIIKKIQDPKKGEIFMIKKLSSIRL